MKKLLLFLLLFPAMAQSQIVNIPDANFKARLLMASPANQIAFSNQANAYIKIDENNDGQIQLGEAAMVSKLALGNLTMTDLEGIQFFTSLTTLYLTDVSIVNADFHGASSIINLQIYLNDDLVSVDFTGMTNLEYLQVMHSPLLQTLDLTPLVGLKIFDCYNNTNLSTVSLIDFPNLNKFRCDGHPNLTTCDLSVLTHAKIIEYRANNATIVNLLPLVNLEELKISVNNLTALNVSTLASLKLLECTKNHLTSLDLTGLTNLEYLTIGDNNLQSIDLSPVPQLLELKMGVNALTSLDLSPVTNLISLQIDTPENITYDVTPLVNLRTLGLTSIPQQQIDMSTLTQLYAFSAVNTQLVSIDLSQATHNLERFGISDNPQLQFINLKCGRQITGDDFYIDNNPALLSLCLDEINMTPFVMAGYPGVSIGTYCSFTPGGAYNTLSGEVRFDADADGCEGTDLLFGNVKLEIQSGPSRSFVFSDAAGAYHFYSQESAPLVITPKIENPNYYNFSPPTATIVFPNNSATLLQSFCITANGVHHDVEVTVFAIRRARPGFDAEYKIVYKNKGNHTDSGNIVFHFDDNKLDFVSSVPNASSHAFSVLQYSFTNLLPFETREIQIKLNVNGPMEIPSVNSGDLLQFTAVIALPDAVDETPADNTFALNQTVVNGLDPNDKQCLQGAVVNASQIGKYLHYQINFENTGNAAAENVVVKDVIDTAQFDIETLEIIAHSHDMDTRIEGDKVEFIFEGIELAPTAKGYVVFKIKTKSNLAIHSSVSNKADIFFDYNFPVITEPAVTTFQLLGTTGFKANEMAQVYPNPTRDVAHVKSRQTIESITMYDFQGRLLKFEPIAKREAQISLQGYATGTYYLKIQTDKGQQTQKMIRE